MATPITVPTLGNDVVPMESSATLYDATVAFLTANVPGFNPAQGFFNYIIAGDVREVEGKVVGFVNLTSQQAQPANETT